MDGNRAGCCQREFMLHSAPAGAKLGRRRNGEAWQSALIQPRMCRSQRRRWPSYGKRCRLDKRGRPPRAEQIQVLVTAWRVLRGQRCFRRFHSSLTPLDGPQCARTCRNTRFGHSPRLGDLMTRARTGVEIRPVRPAAPFENGHHDSRARIAPEIQPSEHSIRSWTFDGCSCSMGRRYDGS
jgi:hypothetical protein